MLSGLYLRHCTNDPDSHSSKFQSTRTLKQLPPIHSFPNIALFLPHRCRPCIRISSRCLLRLCQCGPTCFLSSVGAATSITTKHFIGATNVCLARPRQIFVATNTRLSRQNFSRDKNDTCIILSRQKQCFVTTNTFLLRQTRDTCGSSASDRFCPSLLKTKR